MNSSYNINNSVFRTNTLQTIILLKTFEIKPSGKQNQTFGHFFELFLNQNCILHGINISAKRSFRKRKTAGRLDPVLMTELCLRRLSNTRHSDGLQDIGPSLKTGKTSSHHLDYLKIFQQIEESIQLILGTSQFDHE